VQRGKPMRTKILSTFGIIFLGIGSVITFALFFMETGLIGKLKLIEVPLILITTSFLITSYTYEDSIRELIEHLEVLRFADFVVLAISSFSLIMKILQNFS
jgi:hypothetical protein